MFGTLLHSKTNGITRQTVVLFVTPSCPLKDPAITPTLSFLLSRPSHFFALGFGLGLVPRAPGTFGTLGGFPVAWALLHVPLWAALLTLAVFVYVGCNVCQQAGDALGIPDHGSIVWDEIVAFALILLFAPITTEAWIASFLLFRFLTSSNHGRFGSLMPDSRMALASCSMICSPYLTFSPSTTGLMHSRSLAASNFRERKHHETTSGIPAARHLGLYDRRSY